MSIGRKLIEGIVLNDRLPLGNKRGTLAKEGPALGIGWNELYVAFLLASIDWMPPGSVSALSVGQ